jgi:uncharacterized 2Fe-2S/4Fe-4S cluster protein (DUF4445 family)
LKSSEGFALAFDVGTTTIAASLLDRATGERLASAGRANPQRRFGADVVSRLTAAIGSAEDARTMKQLVNDELASIAAELCTAARVDPLDLSGMAAAGNTVIQHLIMGLPVKCLAFPPYRPLSPSGRTLHTAELGWPLDLPCRMFPMPSGYVGGDLVAFLFGSLAEVQHKLPCLFLDLGTNGEIALAVGEEIYATSVAAGPAFEGGNLTCGMVALPGAVDGLCLDKDRPVISVIGGGRPAGICGSGAIVALSVMLQHGIVDHTGRLLMPKEIPSNLANYVQEVNGELAFLVYRDATDRLYLTQNDIRQIQLAKSAISTGIHVLLSHAGLQETDLEQVVLTGSFGSVLSPQDLKYIGIFSENMVKISRFVHEGALHGVEAAILAADDFASLDKLAGAIRVIPLSGTPAFEKKFFAHMDFPKPLQ